MIPNKLLHNHMMVRHCRTVGRIRAHPNISTNLSDVYIFVNKTSNMINWIYNVFTFLHNTSIFFTTNVLDNMGNVWNCVVVVFQFFCGVGPITNDYLNATLSAVVSTLSSSHEHRTNTRAFDWFSKMIIGSDWLTGTGQSGGAEGWVREHAGLSLRRESWVYLRRMRHAPGDNRAQENVRDVLSCHQVLN